MKIFLIAKTRLQEGVNDFARYKGLDFSEASLANSSGEKLVELAGRICYDSYSNPRPGGNRAYLQRIIEAGHGSVTEHATWTYVFVGVTRALTHELVRHRTMSFSQRSQRYCDEGETYFDMDFSQIPESVREGIENTFGTVRRLYRAVQESLSNQGIDRKTANGVARKVLPECTTTEIVVTFNTRSVRNFLEMRCSRHADKEIRQLANLLFDSLVADSPSLFQDYEKIPLPDGSFELFTVHRKI